MKKKVMKKFCLSLTVLFSLVLISCAGIQEPNWIDRTLYRPVTNQVPHVIVQPEIRYITNDRPVYLEREVVRVVTNDVGSLTLITNINVTTNIYQQVAVYTNFTIITNLANEVTLEDNPRTATGIRVVGTAVNAFAPGWGELVTALLVGGAGIYKHIRNRKANKVLIQGQETSREVIKLISDPGTDAKLREFLIDLQKTAGVKHLIEGLVDKEINKPAAKEAAKEIVTEVASDTARMRNPNFVPPVPPAPPPRSV